MLSAPDTIPAEWQTLDERFKIAGDERIEKLFGGCRWAEGPVYVPAGRYLLWSDIPNDRILRWDETSSAVSIFRAPSGYANGSALDSLGRVVTCEQGGRRIIRTEHDGSITELAAQYQGKRLNSPNDVVVRSDGSVWFTDPSYGIDSDYEGQRAESEIGGCHLYRIDPRTKEVRCVSDDFVRPNGLAFSLDERRLYIVDTRRNHIRIVDVHTDRPYGGEIVAKCKSGRFDGIRLDDAGRIWAAAGDGVHCIDPDGTLLGKLLLPEIVANLTFGGPKRNRLFICASTSLYSILLSVNGAPSAFSR